jgi:hypothetical protein
MPKKRRNEADAKRRREVRDLFLALPENERTGQLAALNFCHWLERNRPDLLVRRKGAPYQHVKSDLSGLW